MTPFQFFIKRSFDLLASAAGGVVLLVPFLFLTTIVRLVSGPPVFYSQERIGRRGRPFTCIKFRTMTTGADAEGAVTTAADRRVTPTGRVLRRCKLDELPQLWNVLIGRMSFVGPRPDVPGYADKLEGQSRKILGLRPGITGPATLYFRYEEELLALAADPSKLNDEVLWPKKVALNLEYYYHWSFWKDIGYILITIFPFLNIWWRLIPDAPKGLKDI